MSTAPKVRKSKVTPLIISSLCTTVLVVLLVRSVAWSEVFEQLKKVSYLYLVPGTILLYLQCIARSMRWKVLLGDSNAPSLKTRFNALMIGNFATFVLPLRAGEFLRPLYLSKRSTIAFIPSFVSVVIERFFDLATVLILFVVATYLLPTMPVEAKVGASSLLVPAVAILVVGLCGALCPDMIRDISEFFIKRLPKSLASSIRKLREDFILGASVLGSIRNWLLVIAWCAVVWGLTIYGYEVLLGLVLEGPQWKLALALTVISAFAVALPSVPGFIGVFQWACVGSFVLFDLPKELAVTFSIVVHLHQYLINIVTGGGILLVDLMKGDKFSLVSRVENS